jgi:hypothetical protein
VKGLATAAVGLGFLISAEIGLVETWAAERSNYGELLGTLFPLEAMAGTILTSVGVSKVRAAGVENEEIYTEIAEKVKRRNEGLTDKKEREAASTTNLMFPLELMIDSPIKPFGFPL